MNYFNTKQDKKKTYYKKQASNTKKPLFLPTILFVFPFIVCFINKNYLSDICVPKNFYIYYYIYLLAFIGLIWIVRHLYIVLSKKTMSQIDKMDGKDFEILLKKYFEKLGYMVSLTPTSNDYGADLVMKRHGKVTIVQAKRYKNTVGNSAVQEIVAAKAYYKADKCMVVTNSYFSKNAKNLAKLNHVELWDRDSLKNEFKIK